MSAARRACCGIGPKPSLTARMPPSSALPARLTRLLCIVRGVFVFAQLCALSSGDFIRHGTACRVPPEADVGKASKGSARQRVCPEPEAQSLKPVVIEKSGAGYGNRTRLAGLGSQSITTMLSPRRRALARGEAWYGRRSATRTRDRNSTRARAACKPFRAFSMSVWCSREP